MDKAQKKVLIMVFAILLLIAVIAVIWSLLLKDENQEGSAGEGDVPSDVLDNAFLTEISILDDYNEFFTVSKIINDYYLSLIERDTSTFLRLLDVDYQREMGIQSNNVFQIIPSNYHSVTYTPTRIYYNADSVVTYYFVGGYLEDVDITDDSSIYEDSIYYLVIVNKNTKHYAIRPLDQNIELEEYANSYHLVEKELEYNTYREIRTSEEKVLVTYLNIFRDLLYLDNEKAYQMLYEDIKEQYSSQTDFYNHKEEIYNTVPSNVVGYSKDENDELTVYRIFDSSQNEVIIYENHIMDFQISY